MVIKVSKHVSGANTTEQGDAVFSAILVASGRDLTVISFDDINTATSSFVNAAFVPLLDHMSLAEIKQRIRVIDSTRQINDMIKRCLERSAFAVA